MEHRHSCDACPARTTHRERKLQTNLLGRLSRIEGQIRGIKGMLERDAYCDEVLHQVAAASSALNSVGKLVLENHLRGCMVERIQRGEEDAVDELIVTIGKLL